MNRFTSTPTSRIVAVSKQLSRPVATITNVRMAPRRLVNPALFVCDIQERFRHAIWEFPLVIATAAKMVRASEILGIPIYITTQNAARLGETVKDLTSLLPPNVPDPVTHPDIARQLSNTRPQVLQDDKTAFSMCTRAVALALTEQATPKEPGPQVPVEVILIGIETHICVTQTALDLLRMGHKVYVLVDGVSSCNAGERQVALQRLAREGAIITTSESILFELLGDASDTAFREISALIKHTKESTQEAIEIFTR